MTFGENTVRPIIPPHEVILNIQCKMLHVKYKGIWPAVNTQHTLTTVIIIVLHQTYNGCLLCARQCAGCRDTKVNQVRFLTQRMPSLMEPQT